MNPLTSVIDEPQYRNICRIKSKYHLWVTSEMKTQEQTPWELSCEIIISDLVGEYRTVPLTSATFCCTSSVSVWGREGVLPHGGTVKRPSDQVARHVSLVNGGDKISQFIIIGELHWDYKAYKSYQRHAVAADTLSLPLLQ